MAKKSCSTITVSKILQISSKKAENYTVSKYFFKTNKNTKYNHGALKKTAALKN